MKSHQPPSMPHEPSAMNHELNRHQPNRHEPSATSYELPFAHHNPDGSVSLDSLIDVSQRFRFIRLQVSMSPSETIALANHLCDHFVMRGMTAPATIQAIRTSTRTRNLPSRRREAKP